MRIATKANCRTAHACEKSQEKGLKIAFFSGSVMSLLVVGLGLAGVSLLFFVFRDVSILFGFGFGASVIALFARVAGGIYTKSADIGADLVGKVEKGLAEDDPKNPAVIADQVGDNVGDVAGMGADLFESYVDAIIAAIALSFIVAVSFSFFPLQIAAYGILASIVGIFFVKGRQAMSKGIGIASVLFLLAVFFLFPRGIFYSILAGLLAGLVVGLTAFYYTSYSFSPTKKIAEAAKTSASVNITTGLTTGMFSTLLPIIAVVCAILISYYFASLYGIALAAVGMLSTLGIMLAADCYGPVADNATGIAEMAKLGSKARERTSNLDAIGNSTAAIGKGFAIGSAALTALVLFALYSQKAAVQLNITNPLVLSGILMGALLPFIFSALTLDGVSSGAKRVVEEVRKQFKHITKGKKPEHEKCIAIVTDTALLKMIAPALLAILTPIIVGFALGKAALGGMLAGSIVTGFMLAITFANTGGALDNAKKFIEDKLKAKGSAQHKASVEGDTVGDGLKDCAGPSLNILIKLMSIVALVFLPLM